MWQNDDEKLCAFTFDLKQKKKIRFEFSNKRKVQIGKQNEDIKNVICFYANRRILFASGKKDNKNFERIQIKIN